jgi:hypothetical protein
VLPKDPPDGDRNVFGGRVKRSEIFRIKVEILMVEPDQHVFPDQVTERFHVKNVSGLLIGLTGHADDDLVIMSMEIRIAALAEHLLVLVISPRLIVEPVRCIEMFLSGNFDLHSVKVNRIFYKRFSERPLTAGLIDDPDPGCQFNDVLGRRDVSVL